MQTVPGRAAGFGAAAGGYGAPMSQDHPEQHEEFTAPEADRAPTPDEARAADAAARAVDVQRVGEHFQDMAATGASVKGEGALLPTADDGTGQQDDRRSEDGHAPDR